MAKVTKAKKPVQSAHSRAARRATSPSIDLDKSLKTLKAPEENVLSAATLAAKEFAGVSKKQKQKPMSRQQRLRREKGMARADAVMDKTETKIIKSKVKGRIVRDRAIDWDALNQEVEPGRAEKKERTLKDSKTKNKDITAISGVSLLDDAMEGLEEEGVDDEDEDEDSELPDPRLALVRPAAPPADDDELDSIT